MQQTANTIYSSLILFQCIEVPPAGTPLVHTHAWLFPSFSTEQAVELFACAHDFSQGGTAHAVSAQGIERHAVAHTSMNSYMNSEQTAPVWRLISDFDAVAVMTQGNRLPIDPYFPVIILSTELVSPSTASTSSILPSLESYSYAALSPAEYKSTLNEIKESFASLAALGTHSQHVHLMHTNPEPNTLFFRGIRMDNPQWEAILSAIDEHTLNAITQPAAASPKRKIL